MRTLTSVSLLVVAICLAMAGCNKSTNAGTTTIVSSLSISYSGLALPGQPITFSCNAAAGSTYLWNFGDGSPTTQATPTHTFNSSGRYTVSVTINDNTDFIVRQIVQIYNDPLYTANIAGLRTWHHKLRLTFADTVSYPDTSFSITELSPLRLIISTDTLSYATTSANVLLFNKSIPVSFGVYGLSLGYDHVKGTIYYNKYSEDSSGSFPVEIFTWP